MKKFGLIGYPLDHSFSKKFFTEKFEKEGLSDNSYENFETNDISSLKTLVNQNPELVGFNITLPYKLQAVTLMDFVDNTAQKIGAINCVRVVRGIDNSVQLHGYNTDAWGFELAIRPILRPHHKRALILGTGGSAKAVSFVLRKLGIEHFFVTREPSRFHYCYADLNHNTIKAYQVIINCTPVGLPPNVDECPRIPYEHLTHKNLLFDLIYNPSLTTFLKKGKEKGAFIHNGYRMLKLQAEKSWNIWHQPVPSYPTI